MSSTMLPSGRPCTAELTARRTIAATAVISPVVIITPILLDTIDVTINLAMPASYEYGCVCYLALSADGRYLAGGTEYGEIMIWDIVQGLALYKLAAHEPQCRHKVDRSPPVRVGTEVVCAGLAVPIEVGPAANESE